MKRIPTEQIHEQLIELIDHLDDDGLVITKDGKAVARLTKYQGVSADLIGSLKHEIKVHGDIYSTGVKWEASDWDPNDQS